MPKSSGNRREPHTIIIARGDRIRHFTVRPWIVGLLGSTLGVMAISYLLATSYLVLRDDLVGATAARQARMQQAYEDRISILRTQVDRITSRQLLDQQLVQGKVAELLARQSQITQRHGQISPIIERAMGSADALPETAPVPQARPVLRATLTPGKTASIFAKLTGEPDSAEAPEKLGNAFWSSSDEPEQAAPSIAPIVVEEEGGKEKADLFDSLGASLAAIETEQLRSIETLTSETFETADTIREALVQAGLPVDADFGADDQDIGGPLVAVDEDALFEERVRGLEEALGQLETLKASAREYPIFNPAPGQAVSSSFGVRRDPFLRRPAMHAGIDFRAKSGTPVQSTGAGKVIRAGWAGGYGRLIEIDHGNGWSTRYAHLSRIDVKVGEKLATGDAIGAVGSTGRSTGPHLHYEIRRHGKATDPLRFLKAGNEIADLL
ncbi:M23 family metallopeptidase [Aliihoeflea sp. 2WW]|uniref:M23 family metallopeptidase n=1 Tax=Aliihoeflea sp. 2WW TaxID=1381123 RepID=UPI000464F83A|nr:M23 family metallopeptidase [Aliihoeflea sp. 2WW]